MQNKSLLITRPSYEATTSYLSHWAGRVVAAATKKGAKVIELVAAKVTRREFEGRVKKMAPNFIALNGHGAKDRVTGHDHEAILDKANVSLTKEAIVYALSCNSAAELGPEAAKAGAKAYIGYKESFVFVTENGKSTRPLQDGSAGLFLGPAMQVAESLLKGHTASEAVSKGRQAFSQSIIKAASSEVQSNYETYIRFLLWDRECLVYAGNGNATI